MNLLKTLRYVPKRFGVLAAVVAAVAIPTALFAWGPSRAVFTLNNPATYVTFNSIKDNPAIGDEREFVSIKDAANTAEGGWKDSVTVEPGKEYLVRIYAHNNAASSLNLKAINTRVSASVPTTTGKEVFISGFVSADNANPTRVWDDIKLTSDKNFNLAYVAGSARIYNNGYAAGGNGQPLPDSIVTSAGAKIGYNGPNGEVPGCFQYANYIYFKVKPQFAPSSNFEMNKTVRINGAADKTFKENVSVKPGDKVDFQVYFKNTGEANLTNVVVKDQLPAGMTYVAGSTWLHNANGTRQVADGVTTSGIMIGNYQPNGDAYVKFTAQVAQNSKLPVCGTNTLKNIAKVETDQGGKQDDATVTVPKECQPPKEEECKPGIPVGDARCEETPPETPEVPEELPSTGPEALIGGLFGSSALGLGISSYVRSRRALRSALNR